MTISPKREARSATAGKRTMRLCEKPDHSLGSGLDDLSHVIIAQHRRGEKSRHAVVVDIHAVKEKHMEMWSLFSFIACVIIVRRNA
jgi:hypothetical protein